MLDSRTDSHEISVSRSSQGQWPQGLKISFQRTVRVGDNAGVRKLSPGLGAFPLYSVEEYGDTLPNSVVSKGGYFFPMYRESEKSTLRFSSLHCADQR